VRERSLTVAVLFLTVHRSVDRALEVVRSLRDSLRELSPGVVSVSGFATAFSDELSLVDSLRVLNAYREVVALFPLRQVWWLTRPLVDMFLHVAPDLESWFMVRLELTEIVAAP